MRLVIKVGTSLIAPGGRIDTTRMRALVDQLDLSRHEYLIVSSGAIASGMANLGLGEKPTSVPIMQACAAVGQSVLMHTYEQLFFGKKVVAQLLLSSDDFTSPVRYKNLQNTMQQLLRLGVVPVVNENDSVSVRELEGAFGDNDELSALLATAVEADWLVLLTDVDGFFVPNGKRPRLLRTIRKLTPPWRRNVTARESSGAAGCAQSCAPLKSPVTRECMSPLSMAVTRMPFRGRWSEKSELIFRRRRGRSKWPPFLTRKPQRATNSCARSRLRRDWRSFPPRRRTPLCWAWRMRSTRTL